MIRWWVALWDHKEAPTILAALRIGVSLVLLGDLLQVWGLGLVEILWTPMEGGGLPDALTRTHVPLVYQWLPPTPSTAVGLHAATCAAALCMALGLFTRFSNLALLLLYAQLALILPAGDRGIDLVLRNALAILLFSRSGATWSLDARLRTGSWRGDGAEVPAWPRHLLVLQVAVIYFMAGVQKVALSWWPMGGWSALYIVLQDPAIARADFSWLEKVYPLTQLATAVTMLFEWGAGLVPMLYWWRLTRERPGRLRGLANRVDLRSWWLLLGVALHLGIALTMALGIFPWGMLALYPAFYHPDEVARLWSRLRGRGAG